MENLYLQEDLEFIADSINLEDLNNKNILITGATGLVGSRIVFALLKYNEIHNTNISVIAFIRDEKKAKEIYGELYSNKNLMFLKGDIRKDIRYEYNIDYIIHCAAVTASKNMIEKPVETIEISIFGTYNVLKLAVEKKVKSFVYVSSMEMYGSFKDEVNVTESKIGYIDPLNVRSNYPESKRMCENMCIAYCTEYGVPIKKARLAQVFGAGILKGENRVFAQFARSVINGENIVLHTNGLSEGNYCYLADAIIAIFIIMIRGKNKEAYNVVNEESHTTIYEMAKMVAKEIAENKIKVIFDIPKSNIFGYAKDTKMKLRNKKLCELGWKPKYGLKESYIRMIEEMKV